MNGQQVPLPFAALPTTESVRQAIANVILDLKRKYGLTDEQLGEQIGLHENSVGRLCNRKSTADGMTITRIGARFGMEALEPYTALWTSTDHAAGDPVPLMNDAMGALLRAKGPKGRFDALPTVKDCISALSGFVSETERERIRLVA